MEGGRETPLLEAARFLRLCVATHGIYSYHLEQPNRPATGSIRFYSFATGKAPLSTAAESNSNDICFLPPKRDRQSRWATTTEPRMIP